MRALNFVGPVSARKLELSSGVYGQCLRFLSHDPSVVIYVFLVGFEIVKDQRNTMWLFEERSSVYLLCGVEWGGFFFRKRRRHLDESKCFLSVQKQYQYMYLVKCTRSML